MNLNNDLAQSLAQAMAGDNSQKQQEEQKDSYYYASMALKMREEGSIKAFEGLSSTAYELDQEQIRRDYDRDMQYADEDAQDVAQDRRMAQKNHKPKKLSWEEYAIQNPKRAARHRISEIRKASQGALDSAVLLGMKMGIVWAANMALNSQDFALPKELAQNIALDTNMARDTTARKDMLRDKLSKAKYLLKKVSLFKKSAALTKATKVPQMVQAVMGVARPQKTDGQPNAVRYAQTGTFTSTQESVVITDAGAQKHNNVFSWVKGTFSHMVTKAFVAQKKRDFSHQVKKDVTREIIENTLVYQARAEHRKQVRAEQKRAELAFRKAKAARKAQRLAQDSQDYTNKTGVQSMAGEPVSHNNVVSQQQVPQNIPMTPFVVKRMTRRINQRLEAIHQMF